MKEIVTVTMNPALDMSTHIEQVMPNRKLRCDAPRYEPGGGGINVSRAIRRLGGTSRALYAHGGAMGEMFKGLLEDEGVNQLPIPIEDLTRESFTVLEESSDQQYRFSLPGPQLKEAEWRRCLEAIKALQPEPDYLVASGSLPPGVPQNCYAKLARLCQENGWRFIVDTWGEFLKHAVDEGVYLIKPNMRELGHLAGEKIEDEAHQEDVARELIEAGKAEVVVVSMGAAGVLLVTEERAERITAPTVKIVSRIGAGDSMVGGIVVALARGDSLRKAVTYGVAAGSAAVKTPGTELCRRETTEALYQKMLEKQGQRG
jgi:6-phosphofructokinase 2